MPDRSTLTIALVIVFAEMLRELSRAMLWRVLESARHRRALCRWRKLYSHGKVANGNAAMVRVHAGSVRRVRLRGWVREPKHTTEATGHGPDPGEALPGAVPMS